MNKIPFQISAAKKGEVAEIRITGHIGWETDANVFRLQVDSLVKAGIQDAHIYINSPGGSCFDAAEIVNIITSNFKGNITGEGGALVASAATYISMHCKTFIMPANGAFMIHKPSGVASGRPEDIRAYLKLLEAIEQEYYNVYKAVAKDLSVFEEKWKTSDWWLTAQEAKEQGFITDVKTKAKIDRETTAIIKACGCPFDIKEDDYQQTEKEMDLKTTAIMLGLPETATEAEVKAKLEANKKAAADLETLRAAQAQKEKTEKEAKIKAALDKAITDKRIKADCRGEWEKMLNDHFETASKALESIAPVEKLSSQIVTSTEGKKTYRGKTFAQLQDEDPDVLADLEKNDPEAFSELFNETYKGGKK
ncbi:MAG: ATP-dependent Clp protease proteolytic subunit [Dysgonamonadaceae bacterium]|jgi:ATP-dependent protease ClpP protease subunit|nr:ATP-dependent Clp protease proteolytic subunit [Dysgonamonadaceae bacterium]